MMFSAKKAQNIYSFNRSTAYGYTRPVF